MARTRLVAPSAGPRPDASRGRTRRRRRVRDAAASNAPASSSRPTSRRTSNSSPRLPRSRTTPSSPRPREQAMGRQDGQRLAGRIEEQRQQVVEGGILLARTAHPALVAVAQGGLVAVVAVGDDDRPGRGHRDERGQLGGGVAICGNGPQAMANAVVVDDIGRRGADRQRVEDGTTHGLRIVVQDDDRARVDAGRAQQLVAVLAGAASVRSWGRTPGSVRRARAGDGRRSRAGSASTSVPGTR